MLSNNISLLLICIYTIVVLILGGVSLKYAFEDQRKGLVWKSHLHKLFTGLMLLIAAQVSCDIVFGFTGYELKEHKNVSNLLMMIDTLPVNYVGMMLVCIAGHTYAGWKRIASHFSLFIFIIVCYAIHPDVGWPWILGGIYVYYVPYVFYLYMKGRKHSSKFADDMYVDSFEHSPKMKYVLISGVLTALFMWTLSLFHSLVTDAIAEFSFIPLWFFLLHSIRKLLESNLIDSMAVPQITLVAEENVPEQPSKEMTEGMKYVADNILVALRHQDFYLSTELNAQLLAEKMGTNRVYISKYLNSTGTNFSTLVNGMRMEHAQKLMYETNYSVSQISQMCGYLSTVTFRKFFVKTFNCTPEDFDRHDPSKPRL